MSWVVAMLPLLAYGQVINGNRNVLGTLDGGYQHGAPGTVRVNISDKLREAVSVRDFGAKGDNTTDDQAAIQQAINNACANVSAGAPATVKLPEASGGYRHAKPLVIPCDYVRLEGAGQRSVFQFEPYYSGVGMLVRASGYPLVGPSAWPAQPNPPASVLVPGLLPMPDGSKSYALPLREWPATQVYFNLMDMSATLNGASAYTIEADFESTSDAAYASASNQWLLGSRASLQYFPGGENWIPYGMYLHNDGPSGGSNTPSQFCFQGAFGGPWSYSNVPHQGSPGYVQICGPKNIAENTEHQYAAAYDGQHISLYVDGYQVASAAATGTIFEPAYAQIFIGAMGSGTGFPDGGFQDQIYNGIIDNVRFSNVARYAHQATDCTTASTSGCTAAFPKPAQKFAIGAGVDNNVLAELNFGVNYDSFTQAQYNNNGYAWLLARRQSNPAVSSGNVHLSHFGLAGEAGPVIADSPFVDIEDLNLDHFIGGGYGLYFFNNSFEPHVTKVRTGGWPFGVATQGPSWIGTFDQVFSDGGAFPFVIGTIGTCIRCVAQTESNTIANFFLPLRENGQYTFIDSEAEGENTGPNLRATVLITPQVGNLGAAQPSVLFVGGTLESGQAGGGLVENRWSALTMMNTMIHYWGTETSVVKTAPASTLPHSTTLMNLTGQGAVDLPWIDDITKAVVHKNGNWYGAAVVPGINTVAFSSTPVFDLSLGNTQKIALTGSVVSSTLANVSAGQEVTFMIGQDAAGGRGFAWPTAIKGGGAISPAANATCVQSFRSDGTNLYAASAMQCN